MSVKLTRFLKVWLGLRLVDTSLVFIVTALSNLLIWSPFAIFTLLQWDTVRLCGSRISPLERWSRTRRSSHIDWSSNSFLYRLGHVDNISKHSRIISNGWLIHSGHTLFLCHYQNLSTQTVPGGTLPIIPFSSNAFLCWWEPNLERNQLLLKQALLKKETGWHHRLLQWLIMIDLRYRKIKLWKWSVMSPIRISSWRLCSPSNVSIF